MQANNQPPTPSPHVPHIHLLCWGEHYADAFHAAVAKHFPSLHDHVRVTVHFGRLQRLAADIAVDAIVSPANSYARLDGGFDDAISQVLSPKDDYGWVTRRAQKVLYAEWKGFAPPGTCTVVPLHDDEDAYDDDDDDVAPGVSSPTVSGSADPSPPRSKFKWGTSYILLCPTMREPSNVRWDREVVYECIWSLLNAVHRTNEAAAAAVAAAALGRTLRNSKGSRGRGRRRIDSILMTPLATGCGRVSCERWAGQCVLAIKHWLDALAEPGKWAAMEWGDISDCVEETKETYSDEEEEEEEE